MEKRVTVKTSGGTKSYKIDISGSTHTCYVNNGGWLAPWDSVGKAKSLEDALSVIRAHAASFGSVKSVDFN